MKVVIVDLETELNIRLSCLETLCIQHELKL